MKSLTDLWNRVSSELGTLCAVSTTRDQQTVASRVEHEGVSFLTITLPAFGKDLQKGLDQGRIADDHFAGFKRRGGLPQFLGGFLQRVFDRKTGVLLQEPDVDSIFALRQLTLMLGKIELPCSDARNARAIEAFLECEQEVRRRDRVMDQELVKQFQSMSLRLFGDVLAAADLAVYRGEVKPKHGPGATADRLRGNAKFDLSEWTTRLESVFPYGDHAIPSWRYYYRLDAVRFLEPGQERPVKVTLVPKTLKAPRVIAIEPTCMQFMQQGLMELLVGPLEHDRVVGEMIGFTDQAPNRRMAQLGSSGEGLATLDLSEASDRVSNQHVRNLFACFPHLNEAVQACRSRKAVVPRQPGKAQKVIRLAKFASMGSALCFPVEAMVFLTVVFVAMERAQGRRFTRNDISRYAGRVRVYGDDIIVPVDMLKTVITHLEAFGLKVNGDKTFGSGKFRESCGGDYYGGVDVTPVRVSHEFPSSRSDAEKTIAAVSLRNRLYEAGLWGTAAWMDAWLRPLLGGHYPRIQPSSPLLGRVSFLGHETQKLHATLHTPIAKGYVVVSDPPPSRVSGEGALLKWFLKRGSEPFADRNHLERSGRPDAVYTKLRWARTV